MKTFRKKNSKYLLLSFDVQEHIFSSLPLKNNKNSFMKPFFQAVYSGRELLGNYLLPKSDVDTIAFT